MVFSFIAFNLYLCNTVPNHRERCKKYARNMRVRAHLSLYVRLMWDDLSMLKVKEWVGKVDCEP